MNNKMYADDILIADKFIQKHKDDEELMDFIDNLKILIQKKELSENNIFELCNEFLGSHYPDESYILAIGLSFWIQEH